jgi:hypothetical protein
MLEQPQNLPSKPNDLTSFGYISVSGHSKTTDEQESNNKK